MDLDEIERLARAAVPGPWKCETFPTGDGSTYTDVTYCVFGDNSDDQSEWLSVTDMCEPANDRYIAAASPDVVIALIAEVRELRGLVAEAQEEAEDLRDAVAALQVLLNPGPTISLDESRKKLGL